MQGNTDRVSGLFFVMLGLGLYFLLIPMSVEVAEDSNIAPDTMPNIVALIMAAAGAFLIVKPSPHQLHASAEIARAALFAVILCLGVLAMTWFGFNYVAPALALVIMLIIGERRPLWLALGGVLMPALIWFLVTQILNRSLS